MKIEVLDEGRVKLEAEEGMFIANGITAGPVIYLGINDSVDNWYEISIEEQEQIDLEKQMQMSM